MTTVDSPKPESDSLRAKLREANERSRRYSSRLWQIPLAFIGIVGVVVGGVIKDIENSPLTGPAFLALGVLGIAVAIHILGMADGHKRAVLNIQIVEEQLQLKKTVIYKPWYWRTFYIVVIVISVTSLLLGIYYVASGLLPLFLQVIGALLLFVTTRQEMHHLGTFLLSMLPRKRPGRAWPECVLSALIRLLVGALGTLLFFDPLIPGTGIVTVHAPSIYSETLDNLRVRIMPIGLGETAGSNHIVFGKFDGSGQAAIPVSFQLFQVRASVEVFDRSQFQQPVVASVIVYVSPFVRRQITVKHIRF